MTSTVAEIEASIPVSAVLQELLDKKNNYENATVRVALIGDSGAGKSSLANAISGKYIAEVGVVEMTSEPQEFTVPNSTVTYVDLPGAGTEKWPTATYVEKLKLLSDYDAFILVNRGRVSESDAAIYDELRRANRHVFIARNFFDAAVEGENGRNETTRRSSDVLRNAIVSDFQTQLQDPNVRVFVTAALPGQHHFELPELMKAVDDALGSINEAKAQRFLEGTKTFTHEMLDRKAAAARAHVHRYAVASAVAAAAIPIPGAGITVDLLTVVAMNKAIARTFNIDVEAAKEDPTIDPLIATLVLNLRRYVTTAGVVALLRPLAGRTVVKEAAKFVPILGPVMAATTSAALIEILGNQAIAEFRDVAAKILEAGH